MSLVLKLKSALKRNYINYCIVNQPYFALLAFIACQLAGCKLITYAHNLEFKRTDGLKKYLRPLTYFLELTIFHLSWKIFFISETERVQACKYFFLDRNKCIYIPHIVPKADDRVQVKFETRHDPIFTLIFFGNFSYPPNKRALDTLFEHILPVLNDELTFPCKLIIFGSHLPDFSEIKQPNSHLSLEILGFVKNPTNVIRQADVMLNPVIDGAGVQTKIIESISLGTTVISTESGARGIGRVAGNKLRCIEDKNWRGFVHEIFNIRSQRLHTLKTPKSFFNTYSATSVTNTVLDSLI